jgi:predicted permease
MRAVAMWLRALFSRRSVESEMSKEMRLHIEMETEENIRRGMSPAEAARRARIAFGGLEKNKEELRDERGTALLEQLVADIRYAGRGMAARPLFAVTVVALLALGTGANTAIFSLVNRFILNPLPFTDSKRMVYMTATGGGGKILITPSPKLIAEWISRAKLVEEISVASSFSPKLGDTTRAPVKTLEGTALGPGLMHFVGMRPVIGRDIQPSDTVAGARRVAILGYGLWQTSFGRRDDVIGTTVLLDGNRHVIIGVAPQGFSVPYVGEGTDIFVAVESGWRWDPIAKLRRGATLAQGTNELVTISAGINRETYADPPRLQGVESVVGPRTRRLVLVLFGAVAFVLLIACANVANLLLARAWSRQREFGVRAAMGASRGRIMRQLFTESLLYGLAGGIAGLAVAAALLKLLTVTNSANIQGITDVRLDAPVLLWTIGLAVITGVLFGLAPALLVGDGRIGDVLKASARSSSANSSASRLRAGLVIAEVGLSVVLLVGTGLLVRSLIEMTRADTGFDPRGLSAMTIRLSEFKDSTARHDVLANVLASVRHTSGISSATVSMTLPPGFAIGMGGLEIEGHRLTADDSLKTAKLNTVLPEFFTVVGLPIRAGRVFRADTRPLDRAGTDEIMINERFARRFWPDGNAIGARVKYGVNWSTVVGIVNDVDVPGERLREHNEAQIYLPMPGAPRRASIVVRSNLAPPVLDSVLRRAITMGNAGVQSVAFAESALQYKAARTTHNFAVDLLGGFAVLALVLAAVGLHAVIAYSVTQREREIGIRIALGAQPKAVARLVFGQGLRLAIIGVVIGSVAAVLATRAMTPFLYKITPGDPATTLAVAAVLMIVALVASALPARRATKVDPVDLVRTE